MTLVALGIKRQTLEPHGELDLYLHAEKVQKGVPQAFVFDLVNKTDHDVRLPIPSVQCEDGFDGSLYLNVDFKPLRRGRPGEGYACVGDVLKWPPILDRIKDWRILHPGDRYSVAADRAHLMYADQELGRYEFWATYTPPYISKADEEVLRAMAIDFPDRELESGRVTFEKR